jgi:hypothetical protein
VCFKDLTDDDIRRIEEEWDEQDDIEPGDLPPWKRPQQEPPAMQMPNMEPGQAVDPAVSDNGRDGGSHENPCCCRLDVSANASQ